MTANEPPIKTVRLINPDGSTDTLPIGSPIRIRLPTEYSLKTKIENYKMDDPVPFNGERIGEPIAEMIGITPAMMGIPPNLTIEEISKRFAECAQYAEAITKASIDVYETLFLGPKPIPLTRWQKIKCRFKNRVEDFKQRAKDIWTILSGGNIHKDCDYY